MNDNVARTTAVKNVSPLLSKDQVGTYLDLSSVAPPGARAPPEALFKRSQTRRSCKPPSQKPPGRVSGREAQGDGSDRSSKAGLNV